MFMRYGDNNFEKAIQHMAATIEAGDNDLWCDPFARNFASIETVTVNHAIMGEISPSVHEAQIVPLIRQINDKDILDATKRVSAITDKERFKLETAIWKKEKNNEAAFADIVNSVRFIRLANASNGALFWDKNAEFVSSFHLSDNDSLYADIIRARSRFFDMNIFIYTLLRPHETIRLAVDTYKKEIKNVDNFVLFTVLPITQAEKADLRPLTEVAWTEKDKLLLFEEISSLLQELKEAASVHLIMLNVTETLDMIRRWPLRIRSVTDIEGHSPYAKFELEKGVPE